MERKTCSRCNGLGTDVDIDTLESITCPKCGGRGDYLWTDHVRIPKNFIFQLRKHFTTEEFLTNKQAYELYDAVVKSPRTVARDRKYLLQLGRLPSRTYRHMNVRNYLCKMADEGSLERIKLGVYRIEIEDYENWFPDDENLPNYAKSNLDHAELEWERDQSKHLRD